ncbi:stage V sporulation protein D [Microaerobacter geothermalis]|uniref:stage V sporulation protein D n=1 Tax=Microaerobacter geothermalis TaxID=674972 RepID=UPI001F44DC2E|nr:stage V sporulation protein D [Microaerobacter geothermalis]MCF6093599.1 stage V sporulation protein D [Microaerobacter geothermalis]
MWVSNVTLRKRIFYVLIGGMLLFLILIGRLGYIQLVKGQWLLNKAEDLWTRDIPFEGIRGKIYDRNGELLAYNISAPSVMAVPAQIKDPANTARQLAGVLNMSEEKVYRLITKRELMVRIAPEGRKISEEKAKEVAQLRLPGIVISQENKRYYPNGAFASHVLGFTGIDNQGLTGIEKVYDERLKGKKGSVSFFSDAKGKEMPDQKERYSPPKEGDSLFLTIDRTIQFILERELEQAMLTYRADNALAIAMDPNTGEILGMASMPEYDPARYQEYPSQIFNRNLPIWKTYEPGSTFKIITLAAALEEKMVDLEKDTFFDPGYAKVAGATLRCWKKGGHGSQTYLEVVENSCNPGFVALGQKVGEKKLFQYIRNFGFGQKTGIDLNGESTGILFKPERIGPVELATTSFGQGVAVTPIQQVAAVSAAINGGKLFQPYIAKEWHDPKTDEVLAMNNPKLIRQVISPETSSQVRKALESVVAKGTGYRAYIDGYRLGGKTGTAQKPAPGGGYLSNEHIVSFIGFAPADDPKVVIYAAVDNPKGIQFGGVVAAPIVRNMMVDVLQYLDVQPRKEQIPKEYRYGEIPLVEVPDLRGVPVHKLQESYFTFRIDTSGSGNTILYQSPQPGTKVERGSTIRIYLGDKK